MVEDFANATKEPKNNLPINADQDKEVSRAKLFVSKLVILILIIVLAWGFMKYYHDPEVASESFGEGYKVGQQELVYRINTDKQIPVLLKDTPESNISLRYMPIEELCGRLQNG